MRSQEFSTIAAGVSVITISFLSAGLIELSQGIGIIFGANIGTTITAILGAISANAAGRRLAVAHLIFNSVTATLTVVFLAQVRWLVDTVSSFAGIAPDD